MWTIFWCRVHWSVTCYAMGHLPMVLGSPTDHGLNGPKGQCSVAAWDMGREEMKSHCAGSGSGWSWPPGGDYRLCTQELCRTEWGLWRDSTSTLFPSTLKRAALTHHTLTARRFCSPRPQSTSQLTMFWSCKLRWSFGWAAQVFCHTKLWKGNTWCRQVIWAHALPNIFAYLHW